MTKKHEQRNTAVEQIVSQLDLSGMTQEELFGQNGLIKALTSRLLNRVLEAEMDAHLGYKKHSNIGDNSGNSRNGYSKKTVLTQDQEVELNIPRDRKSEFNPEIVPKYAKRLPLFYEQIISLYSQGMIQRSWETHWNDLNEFFAYPQEIRRVIYTTNAIESLNASLRKVTKNRAAFPDDEAIIKIMYLALKKAAKKWTMPIQNWGQALHQFAILFGADRVAI